MITSLLIEGVLKIVSIRKDSNKSKKTAQVFDPRGSVPEAILDEIGENIFVERGTSNRYSLTNLGMVGL